MLLRFVSWRQNLCPATSLFQTCCSSWWPPTCPPEPSSWRPQRACRGARKSGKGICIIFILSQWGSVTHQMAVPVPSIGCCVLNHHNLFYQIQNALAFNRDTCCHLALSLRLLPSYFLSVPGADGFEPLNQGILKGDVSLYCWPPVWLVWMSLFCKWKQKLSVVIQLIPNQSNRRSMVQWYFPF